MILKFIRIKIFSKCSSPFISFISLPSLHTGTVTNYVRHFRRLFNCPYQHALSRFSHIGWCIDIYRNLSQILYRLKGITLHKGPLQSVLIGLRSTIRFKRCRQSHLVAYIHLSCTFNETFPPSAAEALVTWYGWRLKEAKEREVCTWETMSGRWWRVLDWGLWILWI